jgi:hypothetical protein
MARKQNGKYLGVFDTTEELNKYRDSIIRKWRAIDRKNRNLSSFVRRESFNLGHDLHYITVKRWLNGAGCTTDRKGDGFKALSVNLSTDVFDILAQYHEQSLDRGKVIDTACRLVLGLRLKHPHLVIFFKTGTAYFYRDIDEKIKCVLNGGFDGDLISTIKMLSNNAEERGMDWLQQYAHKSGLPTFPFSESIDKILTKP